MSTADAIKDLLPIPDSTQPVSDPGKTEVAQSLTEKPTASHELAVEAKHGGKEIGTGAAQARAQKPPSDEVPIDQTKLEHDEEVVNLGWNEPKHDIRNPLVGRLDNEELWLLVRRFNQQMYHVKEIQHPVPGGLDLNIADEDEFSPDKLRSTVERLYTTVIIGIIGAVKQIARLRSWRETRRTAWFCTVYSLAWAFDFLVPIFSIVAIALIVYPPARTILFPPAPIALVDGRSGGVQKPKSGVLGSDDSATGAPENFKGEAVEQEASNFVNGIASVALSSATGKHPQSEPAAEEGSTPDSVPDPTSIAVSAADAKDKAAGSRPRSRHDKTKEPMENAMWSQMRPIMHGIGDVADTWERFANALSPTPPFPRDLYRLRLAGLVVPLLGISIFVSSYMFMKSVSFGVGFGFFGNPIIMPAYRWLNKNYPHWQKLLELRNTLLKGVPTNAQLTITLLRIGEANKAPLPPPPRIDDPPPEESTAVNEENLRATGGDYPLNASAEELDATMTPDPSVPQDTGGADIAAAKTPKHGKKGSRLLAFFKSSTKASVETALGADKLKATAGSEHAKHRLGAVPNPRNRKALLSGPSEFKARYRGKRGHVYIKVNEKGPCMSFSTDKTIETSGTVDREDHELHPTWSVPAADIKELKKVGGFGWKAKLVIGWALDREVADGLEIIDRKGDKRIVTAMPLRDELFDRLVALGGQKWEAW